jgi:2-haloacid dehalogenase
MAARPLVIAFDVIETLFPLEPLRERLTAVGVPGVLEVWFARLLRDAVVLVATDGYRPFGEIATAALRATAPEPLDDDAVQSVLAGFAELDPHPDVKPAVERGREAGIRMVALTNGSAANTAKLLRRAGIDEYIEQVLSVDDVRRWKPAPEIYWHAVSSTGVPAERLALVAAHAWDTHGAHHAGLTTGWVARLEGIFPAVFSPPDVTGRDLVEVVEKLAAMPES